MPAPRTPEQRFAQAEAAKGEAWRIASLITEDTPGRERGVLINRTRTAYNKARSAVAKFARPVPAHLDTPEKKALRRLAESLLDDAHAALTHARRFSE